jgi:glycosyltransferase involved in cell wall biosynthesis
MSFLEGDLSPATLAAPDDRGRPRGPAGNTLNGLLCPPGGPFYGAAFAVTIAAMKKMSRWLSRAGAISILVAVYSAAWLLSRVLNRRGQGVRQPSGCILAIGTFYNPNWIQSHIRPLARSGIGEVILVCDDAVRAMVQAPIAKVRLESPPSWMAALLTRAVAKFLWSLRCALRYRPDLYMGYHIFPAAVSALVLARLFNRPACYQDTSGPLELEGGGWHAENPLLAALQRPAPLVERAVSAVVREFDSVVVRGSGAESYIRQIGYRGSMAIITGSVEPSGAWLDFASRTIDIVFVGRLCEYKRPDRFVAALAEVVKALPATRAVMIGDGPDAEAVKAQARELGLAPNLQFLGKRSDVDELLARSRVFMLTSRWEGLSIAMIEAMAAGAVPVVANVGDLADLAEHGSSGFVVAPDDIAAYARACVRLLSSKETWSAFSKRSVGSSLAASGIEAIARRWQAHLHAVIAKPPLTQVPASQAEQ